MKTKTQNYEPGRASAADCSHQAVYVTNPLSIHPIKDESNIQLSVRDLSRPSDTNLIGQNCGYELQSMISSKGLVLGPSLLSHLEVPLMLVIFSLGMALIVKRNRRL